MTGLQMANIEHDLGRWVERGLISEDQRAAILGFEQERLTRQEERGPGRLANGVSTVGAAVAIAGVAGIVVQFTDTWSSGQAMVAAIGAAMVMFLAAWQLVRNGWGAPAGLCAICGLVLIPAALMLGTEVAGWWPEERFDVSWEQVEREQRRVTGMVLLLSILPGMATTRLGLRQAWMALPVALWYGAALPFTDPFENTVLIMAQVVYGTAVAGFAAFVWGRNEPDRNAAWWLQLGGLGLAGVGIAFSAFQSEPGLALLAAVVAAGLFVVGVTRDRTSWMVAGAISGIFPVASLIFEYFEGLAGLFIIAVVGLAIAFLPLVILRRQLTARG